MNEIMNKMNKTPDRIMQDVGIDYNKIKNETPMLYDSIRRAMDDFADQYHEWKLSKVNDAKTEKEQCTLHSVSGLLPTNDKIDKIFDDMCLYSTEESEFDIACRNGAKKIIQYIKYNNG